MQIREYDTITNISKLLSPLSFSLGTKPGPEVVKQFLYSTQLSIQYIMLIIVKMPTIVGILTIISMINTTPESLKARKVCNFQHFRFYEQ